jgi:plastocyanin
MTDQVHDRGELGTGWRLVAAATALVMVIVAAVIQLTQEALIPPLIVLPVLLVVGLALLTFRPRLGAIVIGATAVLMVLGNLPFVIDDLAHPESFFSFVPAVIGIIGGVVGAIVLAAAALGAGDGLASYVGVLGAVGVVGVLAVGLVSANPEDDSREEGDIGMFAQDTEFVPDEAGAEPGDVGIYIGNDDLVRHTFLIDELDVDEELPAEAFVRVAFEAEPGTYEFYCDVPGHDDMKGTLTVLDVTPE